MAPESTSEVDCRVMGAGAGGDTHQLPIYEAGEPDTDGFNCKKYPPPNL